MRSQLLRERVVRRLEKRKQLGGVQDVLVLILYQGTFLIVSRMEPVDLQVEIGLIRFFWANNIAQGPGGGWLRVHGSLHRPFLFLSVIFVAIFESPFWCAQWGYLFDADWHSFSVEQYFSRTWVQVSQEMNLLAIAVCFTVNTEAGPGVWGFLVKQVALLSFWVISPSGSELPARQLHTCRKWTTPNQPSWGFFGAWAGLSIVISNGILGRAGVQEIKSWLCYPSIAAQSQALSSGRPFPSQNLFAV